MAIVTTKGYKMRCMKCKNELFKIETRSDCNDCAENAAYDKEEGEYVYSSKIIEKKGLIRDHVDNEGECDFGIAHGTGCWIIICTKCGTRDYMPMVDH